jgi:hypothetical protein
MSNSDHDNIDHLREALDAAYSNLEAKLAETRETDLMTTASRTKTAEKKSREKMDAALTAGARLEAAWVKLCEARQALASQVRG